MRIAKLIGLLLTLHMSGQIPKKFQVIYGGYGVDIAYSVKEIYNNQYIIAGTTSGSGNGALDACLLLMNNWGHVVWQKNYGGPLSEVAKCVVFNPADSGFILTGYTSSFGNGGYDFYTIRTDKSGNIIWQNASGSLDWDFGASVCLSGDNHVIICGTSYNSTLGKKDGYIAKLNMANGTLMWSKYLGGAEDDDLVAVKKTSDGQLTVSGNTKSFEDTNNDYWLIKLNDNGDTILTRRLGNKFKAEYTYDFIEDKSNTLVFCGSYDTSYANTGKFISYVLKTSLAGSVISTHTIAGAFTDEDRIVSIAEQPKLSDYFVSRRVYNFGSANGIDIQPALLDNGFNFAKAAATFGNFGEDEAESVICTSDNGFLMVGFTKSTATADPDMIILKMDSSFSNVPNVTSLSPDSEIRSRNKGYYHNNCIYLFPASSAETETHYCLYNTFGQVIKQSTTQQLKIILPELANGVYYMVIKRGEFGEPQTIKFISTE